MKKAAIIAPNSLPVPPIRGGGIQNGIAEIIKHYKNYKPYVFSICEPGVDDLPLFEVDGNAQHHRICLPAWEEFKINLFHLSRKSYFPYIYTIAKKLIEIKPDIVHVRSRPWFLPILRKYLGSKVKIIEHNHNNYFMEMKKDEVEKYLKQMDAFAAVSQFTANVEVLVRFPQESKRCFVIYNGVNLEKFDPRKVSNAQKLTLRDRFKANEHDVIVSYLGRVRKSKGVDVLLAAAKKLIKGKGIKNLKILIVGGNFFGGDTTVTPFMRELYREAEEIKDNIIFTGFIPRDEIENIYGISDIIALPSLVEDASPNVCYEAQAMEVPIVSTKRGGIPEIVKEGETALLVDDPEDSGELSKKLLRLIESPEERRAFGRGGRFRVKENFTWEMAAQRTEDMYDKVLNF
jgi:glycosyltransferase involved in cell wall biosynthesis